MRLRPCWSCGADNAPCDRDACACAKCVDPEGYDDWRENNPDQYDRWLHSQREDSDDDW